MDISEWIKACQNNDEAKIRLPDLVIEAISLDPVARVWEELGYPFKETPVGERSGCYLFYDSYKRDGESKVVPIYAGKSKDLSKRLYGHWSGGTENLDDFMEESNEIQDMGSVLYEYTECQFVDGKTKIAIWLIKDERERMLFEHKIIGILQPLYNRG